MFQSAASAGEKNKIVPGWLRALFILPCLAGAVWWMIYCGSVFDYIADIQIGWFDGYYVIITTLLTVVVYLLMLLVSLIPALILTRIARTFYEKRQKPADVEQTNERSRYQ